MTTIRSLTAVLLAGGLATGAASHGLAATHGGGMGAASGACPDSFAALKDSHSDNVSAQEARQIRTKIFESLDGNDDDIVSREEYVECLSQTPVISGSDLAELQGGEDRMGLLDKSDSRFGEIDADDNGRISYREYMKAARERFEKSKADSKQSAFEAAHLAGYTFAKIDADVSGDITTREWGANIDRSADATRKTLDRSFSALDADNDGKITKEEYQAASDRQFDGAGKSRMGMSPAEGDQASIPVWDYQIWVIE